MYPSIRYNCIKIEVAPTVDSHRHIFLSGFSHIHGITSYLNSTHRLLQQQQQQQQQQQHSFFSQASWGRLEMKPERKKVQGSGTLIASLQALLSKAISLEIFQSLRSLLTDSSHVSLGLPLPLFTLSTRSRTPLC